MDEQLFQVEYHTQNLYELPVKNAHWQLLVLPENNEHQKRLHYSINSNLIIKDYITDNLFSGQSLHILASGPFWDFQLSIKTTISIKKNTAFNFDLLSVEEEKNILSNHQFYVENGHFLINDKLTKIPESLAINFSYWGNENLTTYLMTLMNELNSQVEFSSGETEVNTTAVEALELKKGVCQDFAHICIGLLRRQKIPCRYVCGYLCQGMNFKGDAFLHAWVECFIPGGGWVGIDPSNNLFSDHNYIKISHGRNFDDCTPIRGVLETGGTNTTSHQVKVFHTQQQ
ncbi:MAG: transglutaminase family protein [Lentisphaeraceae bacterium]|nr:transglutaminase family protein [Lentisphaeraceae bacterium]